MVSPAQKCKLGHQGRLVKLDKVVGDLRQTFSGSQWLSMTHTPPD